MNNIDQSGTVICRLPGRESWGRFSAPARVISCCRIEQLDTTLRELESALAAGFYAAGFIAYEAGAAFDWAFPQRQLTDFPLLWFGLYQKPPMVFELPDKDISAASAELETELSGNQYHDAVDDILAALRAGDIYQVNYTFRLRGGKTAKPWDLFIGLQRKHPVPYAAYIHTGDEQIVSMSPELFLERNGNDIFTRPMKGTAGRSRDMLEDGCHAEGLKRDVKSIAENLMIVDMARNDLGRVCCPGSIYTEPLFHVERYETLYQMTSTVHGELLPETAFSDIMRACFPAASITGAPKVAAMHKIHELENSPRKVYTGSMGCIFPDGNFCLNVAIRTVICGKHTTELGVGGGIVYDSDKNSELAEAMLKSRFIHAAEPDFELLETMLLDTGRTISYLDAHLRRMENSARFFKFNFDLQKAKKLIDSKIPLLPAPSRLRLLLDFRGKFRLQAYPLKAVGWGCPTAKIKLSPENVCSSDVFLRHKTTRRDFYNKYFKQAVQEGFDEVIFCNERGEICEGAITNIFIQDAAGEWFTPPLSCGLLPGTWRAETIKKYNAIKKVIYPDDLETASRIFIGNSVRGEIEARCAI